MTFFEAFPYDFDDENVNNFFKKWGLQACSTVLGKWGLSICSKVLENKIRNLFKVKLYTIRSETK